MDLNVFTRYNSIYIPIILCIWVKAIIFLWILREFQVQGGLLNKKIYLLVSCILSEGERHLIRCGRGGLQSLQYLGEYSFISWVSLSFSNDLTLSNLSNTWNYRSFFKISLCIIVPRITHVLSSICASESKISFITAFFTSFPINDFCCFALRKILQWV